MEDGSSTFQGSSQAAEQSNQFLTSGVTSTGDFYASVGTLDETVQGPTIVSTISELRSRSTTPASIPVNSPLTIPSRSSFSAMIPSLIDVEASLKNIFQENGSQKTSSIRSAWIPSERTSGALHAIASSVPPSDFMGADQLTKPGIMSDKLFVNPAFDLAMRFVGTIPPSMMSETPEEMLKTNDVRGLLEKGFYSSAANVSAKLLYAFEQGYGRVGQVTKHSPQSLILWTYRITALTMLDQLELAAKEMEAFGDLDNPDLYFEYYSQSSDEKFFGSMVPFPLRLLHARIPQRIASPKTTFERLFSVKDKIESMLQKAADGNLPTGVKEKDREEFLRIWQIRRVTTLYHIVAAAIQAQDFDTAIILLRILLKLRPENEDKIWNDLGIVFCQMGIVKKAEICFDASQKAAGHAHSDYVRLLHRAILTVCQVSPAQALEIFSEIFTKFPEDSSAANGVAVGHFYAGRMSEAMLFLEKLVLSQPRLFLTEQSVRNLVALYELQNIQVRERKLRLLSLICQFIPDGRGVNHLKLMELQQ